MFLMNDLLAIASQKKNKNLLNNSFIFFRLDFE